MSKFELGKFEKNEKPHVNTEEVGTDRVMDIDKAREMAKAGNRYRAVSEGDRTWVENSAGKEYDMNAEIKSTVAQIKQQAERMSQDELELQVKKSLAILEAYKAERDNRMNSRKGSQEIDGEEAKRLSKEIQDKM